jgi:8-oxo-dGTP pyrophosphatase MutT (NUDIX family)
MTQKIRVISLGLICRDRRVLLSEGFDTTKQLAFCRCLGGGVEFGETSEAALRREFQEELRAELTNVRYLASIDNIFEYEGKPGHEIVQLFQADLVDEKLYALNTIPFYEGDLVRDARWIPIDDLKSHQLRLVPEGCLDYLPD